MMVKYELVTENVFDINGVRLIIDYEHEDIWMDQKTIAGLLGTTVKTISYHLNKKFESGELVKEEAQVNPNLSNKFGKLKINTKTANQPILYNLDALIAVAYSVNSKRALQVRKWANGVLKKYVVHGVVANDNRLINDQHTQQEVYNMARNARVQGNKWWNQIIKAFSLCSDYDSNSLFARQKFPELYNKMLFAISNRTAADLIMTRANSNKPNAGLTTWTGKKGPTLSDAEVGTNYLYIDEQESRSRLTEIILLSLNDWIIENGGYTMQDFIIFFNDLLKILKKPQLQDKGNFSHKQAINKGRKELQKWRNSPNKVLIDVNQTQLDSFD